MPTAPAIEDLATEAAYWRGRAERAEARLADAEERLAGAERGRTEAEERISELSEQVAVLGRMMFGRRSERKDRPAPDPDPTPAPAPGAGGGDPPDRLRRGQRRGSKGHGRRDYSHLDTREEVHDVPEAERTCPCCGTAFEAYGTEDAEQVDWQVKITRIVHRRRRYRRRCACPGPRAVIAPVPPRPVARGRFTASFLARLLYEKYVLGRPLHRIARALAADGLEVAEGTLCGALRDTHALLAPLEEAIAARNAAAGHVHADETSWRVFEHVEGREGHRWWLWVFVAADTVVFRMDPTRSTAVPEAHLGVDRADGALPEGRRLLLSADFYSAYQALARVEGVDPLWCWAHIRRYFIRAGDAHAQLRYWRDLWVGRIAALYTAHRALAAAEPGTDAHHRAGTAFEAALADIDTARREQAAAPGLHPAARKVLATLDREWDGLARHLDFPDIDLDNNIAERSLRTPVVGRKNYYGAHAEWSAHLAARVWTVTGTAERNGREPLAYLTDYLNACAEAGGRPPGGPALERFLVWLPAPGDTAGSHDHDPSGEVPPGPSP